MTNLGHILLAPEKIHWWLGLGQATYWSDDTLTNISPKWEFMAKQELSFVVVRGPLCAYVASPPASCYQRQGAHWLPALQADCCFSTRAEGRLKTCIHSFTWFLISCFFLESLFANLAVTPHEWKWNHIQVIILIRLQNWIWICVLSWQILLSLLRFLAIF